jgi:hypothetical protein
VVEAPADAASASLTVSAIGRDGKSVATFAVVAGVTNLATYTVTTGKATSVPRGTYDVMTDVFNSRDGTDTLGSKRVTISGTTKLTFDARQGKALRASLHPAPPSGYAQHFLMALCSTADPAASVQGFTYGDVLYVIPSSSKTLETVYSPVWEPQNLQSHDGVYLATATHHDGIPSGGTASFQQSSMATVDLHAYSGPVTGSAQIDIRANSSDSCRDGAAELDESVSLPFSLTAHLQAGSYASDEVAQDYIFDSPRTYAAKHTYPLNLNHAAWGPSGQLPYVRAGGHRLYLNTDAMFTDPILTAGPGETTSYTLTLGGRKLLSSTPKEAETLNPVITKAGWYTLSASAIRHTAHPLPAGALSPRSSLVLRFYADPDSSLQMRGYVTRFVPLGMDSYDRAKPVTHTTVDLGLQRSKPYDGDIGQPSDSVADVKTWYSADDGHTWHATAVKHSGTSWSTVVPNGKSGEVSLRSTVTDSHGSTSTTTIYQAYGLS